MEAILKEEKTTFPTFDEFLKKVNNHSPKSRENIILDLLKTMKHYEKKYPFFITWIVILGIWLMEKYRVAKV